MNRNKLKTYAPAARREFIQAVKDRAVVYGLSAKKIEPMTERGDVVLIPIRMGVGLRLGINAGYMKFSTKQKWFPF